MSHPQKRSSVRSSVYPKGEDNFLKSTDCFYFKYLGIMMGTNIAMLLINQNKACEVLSYREDVHK